MELWWLRRSRPGPDEMVLVGVAQVFRAGLCSARYCIREGGTEYGIEVPSSTHARHGRGRDGTAQYLQYTTGQQ